MRLAACAVLAALAAPRGAIAKPRWRQLPEPAALPEAATTGDLPIDDFTLHYTTYGTGPAIVLLHGGLGSSEQWGGQVAALAVAHQVIAVDSRGHGRSSRSAHGISYHQLAQDVIALLDHLALDRATVVGWSDGGVVGLDLAIHHPDRLTRLVVLGANYDPSGMKPAGKAPTFAAYFTRAAAAYKRLSPAPEQLAAFRKELRAMWRSQPVYTEDQLRAIRTPTLVLLGDHDEIIRREHAEQLAGLIPRATVAILADASHFALWQDPAGVAQAVLGFVDAR